MNSKYIIFEAKTKDGKVQKVIPVLFPSSLIHADVADVFMHQRVFTNHRHNEWMWPKPVSAGFFNGSCHGRSESMGVDSREGDTEILLQLIRGEL